VQEAGHPQEIERTEEEGRETACGFGEIGENCDFTILGRGYLSLKWLLRILNFLTSTPRSKAIRDFPNFPSLQFFFQALFSANSNWSLGCTTPD